MLKISKNAQRWKDRYLAVEAEYKQYKLEYDKKFNEKLKLKMMAYAVQARKKATARANKKLQKHIDIRRVDRTSYFEGLFSYLQIVTFTYKSRITHNQMAYIILLNIVPQISVGECSNFGFGKQHENRKYLERLVKSGWAERFDAPGKRVMYGCSMAGRRLFLDFRKHARAVRKQLEQNNEYKRKKIEWNERGNEPN